MRKIIAEIFSSETLRYEKVVETPPRERIKQNYTFILPYEVINMLRAFPIYNFFNKNNFLELYI